MWHRFLSVHTLPNQVLAVMDTLRQNDAIQVISAGHILSVTIYLAWPADCLLFCVCVMCNMWRQSVAVPAIEQEVIPLLMIRNRPSHLELSCIRRSNLPAGQQPQRTILGSDLWADTSPGVPGKRGSGTHVLRDTASVGKRTP